MIDKRTTIALASILSITACAAPGSVVGSPQQMPVSRVDRVQIGDNNLSCSDIADQIAKMDKLATSANAAQTDANGGVMAASSAGTAASVGLGTALAFVPFVGGIASAGVGIATGNAANNQAVKGAQAMQDTEDAKERKMTLVGLANGKGCSSGGAAK